MGSCKIDSGYIPGGVVPPSGDCVVPAGGRNVLICPETPAGTQVSGTFTVNAGQGAVLDAYNLVPGYHIYVQRIVRRAYCATVGNACDPLDMAAQAHAVSGPISFMERMTLGGHPWAMIKQSDDDAHCQMLIAIPGVYRLELEDPDAMLGNLEVEYIIMPMTGLSLPAAYFAGVQ